MAELLVLSNVSRHVAGRLGEGFNVAYRADIDLAAWLHDNADTVRYIFTDGPTGIADDLLAELPNLEIISNLGVGYDGVNTDIATARGIPVTHTPGVLNEEVATTTVLLYLACWRNFEAELAQARSGRWVTEGNLPLPQTADGRKIGILGLGRIGKAIAHKLGPWADEICYFGRNGQDVSFRYFETLVDMARYCDVVINIAPGGDGTYRMIDRAVMDAIGPKGRLINVGRGSSVDEAALIAALAEGTLGGAGLDVYENEPHIPEALRQMTNVVLLPHVASASLETRQAMGDLAVDNLIAWKEGRPLLTPVPESASLL